MLQSVKFPAVFDKRWGLDKDWAPQNSETTSRAFLKYEVWFSKFNKFRKRYIMKQFGPQE